METCHLLFSSSTLTLEAPLWDVGRHLQIAAQQLGQQGVAEGGKVAGLRTVGVGLFQECRAGAVEVFKNLWHVGQRELHGSDDFGAHGWVGSAVSHLTEMVEYFGLGQSDMKE